MKKIAFCSLILCLLAGSPLADARSQKRGVGENQFNLLGQMTPLAPGISWYYNWGNTPNKGYQDLVVGYDGIEYVPMAWNGINADNVRQYCKEHPGVKYLLGFNEPNFKAQSNLTPQQAAEKWPELQALAKELGLKLVAPALNYSPDAPYQQPSRWMDEFVQLVGPDAFDFTAIHCYGGLGVIKTLATEFYQKYGKPVWLTEFCYWPGGAGSVYVAPSTQLASMIESVEWLETTDFIYRYAWFKAVGSHDAKNSPNYGLLISSNGLDEKELSPQGWVYTYMSEFDRTVWNPLGTPVAASEYVHSKGVSLAKGENPDCPRPIEISQFNSGAEADYQFDIPAAGTYTLTLTVSGQGEPTRFDPTVAAYLVDAEGNAGQCLLKATQFTLPGSDTQYITRSFPIDLPAGHITLRIADAGPWQPSGIHISTLRIDDPAGVSPIAIDSADTLVDVHDTHGRCIRHAVSPAEATQGLPAGLYLVGNRKTIIR